jgi:transposase
MTATEAAKKLGVSRKTYYKWEQRGLASLLEGVQDHPPGRPEDESGPGPREEELEKRIAELERENELMGHKMNLQHMLHQIEMEKRRKKKR